MQRKRKAGEENISLERNYLLAATSKTPTFFDKLSGTLFLRSFNLFFEYLLLAVKYWHWPFEDCIVPVDFVMLK